MRGISRPQCKGPKDKVAKNDDGKQPVEPDKEVNKDSGVEKKIGFWHEGQDARGQAIGIGDSWFSLLHR